MGINTFDSIIDFRRSLLISDVTGVRDTSAPIGDWVKACIFLGMWVKSQYQKDTRRITFVVLPSRDIATAFIALGALVSSLRNYKDGLSWEKFSTLSSGVEIFWKKIETGNLFTGRVLGVECMASETAIKLEITKSRKSKDIGVTMLIPESQFNRYHFSVERPASSKREAVINSSLEFMELMIGNVAPAWAVSNGQDLLLVTKMNKFKALIHNVLVGVEMDKSPTMPLENLLGFEQLGIGRHSKMKITHPKGDLDTNADLVILDGSSAFSIKDHIPLASDLLIVFESLEFNENELEFVNQVELATQANAAPFEFSITLGSFPVGFEVSSYSFTR
jgi:hypothetical protein